MKILVQISFVFFLTVLLFNSKSSEPPKTKQNVQSAKTSLCHTNGVLPDPSCTPGTIDPNVVQENIYQTICKKGYTKTVRPSVDYTEKLKIEQIKEYGYSDISLRDYEEDHLIPLEVGGSPSDPKNLWPEPINQAHEKDNMENLCNVKVCDGKITLIEAQKEIGANWQTACQ